MSHERRREMVYREHPVMSTVRQCNLLDISRSSLYYRHKGNSSQDLAVMKAIDHQYLVTPFYGSLHMTVWLNRQGYSLSRKRVQRLCGLWDFQRSTGVGGPASGPPGHKVYPYLLGGMDIARPNQVWAADITYIPMARGFL